MSEKEKSLAKSTNQKEAENMIKEHDMVVVDFWTEWCPPCKRMEPVFEKMAGEYDGAIFLRVNTDENPEMAMKLNITAIPTFIIFKDGKEFTRVIGAIPAKLEKAISQAQGGHYMSEKEKSLAKSTNQKEAENMIKEHDMVVVDFWTEWCPPCKIMEPVFEKMAGEYDGAIFLRVNTDENIEMAMKLNITAIPTFIIFKDGKEFIRVIGALPDKLEKAISQALN